MQIGHRLESTYQLVRSFISECTSNSINDIFVSQNLSCALYSMFCRYKDGIVNRTVDEKDIYVFVLQCFRDK